MILKRNYLWILIAFLGFFSISVKAQFTDQDCLGAIPICSNEYIPYHSGVEFNDFGPPLSSAGCLNDEVNSVWLYIQVDQTSPPGATLTMIITPENGMAADYDWALFGPNYFCGQLGTPLRCSAAPANCFYCPNTGFVGGQGFPLNAEDKATGDGYLPLIGTFPGEGYYILVNNYNNDPGGFTISFGGGTILDCTPTPPCMMQVFTSADVTVCQGEAGTFDFTTTELGGGGLVDWEWTSVPSIAVNFLSDKNSPNPSVTIPPSFSGQIVYTVTGTIPVCSQSEDIVVTVIPAPIVTLQPLPTQICSTADPIPLNFSPPGGYFEGNGPIFGGVFNPSEWGPGDFILTYKVEFASGCVGDAEIDLNIVNGPEATIDFVDEFCINDPVFTLQATQQGGKWGGVANSKGEIDPKKLGVGSYKATYLVDDGFCKNSDEINIEVKPLPVVTIIDPGPFCDDQTIQTLTGLPNKGKWSGVPDTLGKFNPSLLGAGNYIAYYNYTDLFGCKNADTLSVKINPKPGAVITPVAQVCNATDNNNTTILNFDALIESGDAGGIWTDTNNSGATGTFPNLDFLNVPPGKYIFTYTTNSAIAPCTESSYSAEIEVVDCKCPAIFLAPSVSLCNDNNAYNLDNLKLNPNAGSWSVISNPAGSNPATLSGTSFNALNKDAGNYVVEFMLSSAPPAGCPETSTATVTVNKKPSASFSSTKAVCNKFLNGNTPVTLNLNTYITAGDNTGNWVEITSSGATGVYPVLDFTGVTPGTYTFQYTTNSAVSPCTESVYVVDVIVQDCECPSLALINYTELCNSAANYNLDLLKITTETGSWSVKSTPSGSNPAVLNGSVLNISGKDPGIYVFSYTLTPSPPVGCPLSADITVTLFSDPSVTVTGNVSVCNSNKNGNNSIIDLQSLITSGSKSGNWTDTNSSGATGPDNAKDFNGILPGNYTFTFTTNTANFPCIDKTYSVVIKVNDCNCPDLQLTPYTALCNKISSSINLNTLKVTTESGTWNIKTKPAGTNPATLTGSVLNVSNVDPGIYVITFSLSNTPPPGCPTSADLTIEIVAPPTAVLNPSVNICNSKGSGQYPTTLNLYNQITSGDKSGTFTDTDNSGAILNGNIFDFNGVTPGTYTFTYTTNSSSAPCSESVYTIDVIVENCDCPSVATKNPGNLCSDNANLDLNTLKLTSESGNWTITSQPSGPNNASITGNIFNGQNSNPGVYVITFKLQNAPPSGCPDFSQQSFTISQALSSGTVVNPVAVCQSKGQIINLTNQLTGASPGGSWKEISSVPSQNNAQNIQNGLFNTQNQAPGVYLLEYKVVPALPCQENSTVLQITVNPDPVADAGNDQTITCSNPSVNIGGSNTSTGAGINYSWSGGITASATANVSLPGSYTLTVTNTLTGCIATDIVTVKLANDLPLPENLVVDSVDCFGKSNGKIRFDDITGGASPYKVFLNDVDFGKAQYFTKLPPGDYILKIVDVNGCSSEQNIVITEPDEIYLELGDDITVTLGDSTKLEPFINIGLNEIDTIIWSPVIGNACTSCFEPVITPYYTTPLEMLVIDKNGCRVSDKIVVTVDVIRPIYFPNIFSANGDALNDRFYPFAGDLVTNIIEFKIFDRWGDLVFSQSNFKPNNYDKGWDGTRNGQRLNAGVYVYYALVEFKDGAKKIFKGDVTLKH